MLIIVNGTEVAFEEVDYADGSRPPACSESSYLFANQSYVERHSGTDLVCISEYSSDMMDIVKAYMYQLSKLCCTVIRRVVNGSVSTTAHLYTQNTWPIVTADNTSPQYLSYAERVQTNTLYRYDQDKGKIYLYRSFPDMLSGEQQYVREGHRYHIVFNSPYMYILPTYPVDTTSLVLTTHPGYAIQHAGGHIYTFNSSVSQVEKIETHVIDCEKICVKLEEKYPSTPIIPDLSKMQTGRVYSVRSRPDQQYYYVDTGIKKGDIQDDMQLGVMYRIKLVIGGIWFEKAVHDKTNDVDGVYAPEVSTYMLAEHWYGRVNHLNGDVSYVAVKGPQIANPKLVPMTTNTVYTMLKYADNLIRFDATGEVKPGDIVDINAPQVMLTGTGYKPRFTDKGPNVWKFEYQGTKLKPPQDIMVTDTCQATISRQCILLDYNFYASETTVQSGATIEQTSYTTEGITTDVPYQFISGAFQIGGAVVPSTTAYTLENDSGEGVILGVTQSATVDGKTVSSPIFGQYVEEGLDVSYQPQEVISVFLQRQAVNGQMVASTGSQVTVVTLSPQQKEAKLMYQNGHFVIVSMWVSRPRFGNQPVE
eukprot:Em0018g801a